MHAEIHTIKCLGLLCVVLVVLQCKVEAAASALAPEKTVHFLPPAMCVLGCRCFAFSASQAYHHIYGGVVQLAWPRAVYRQVILNGRLPYLSQLLGRPLEQRFAAANDKAFHKSYEGADIGAGRLRVGPQQSPRQQQPPNLPQGMWGESLSKDALKVLVSLHLREFDLSGCHTENPKQPCINGNKGNMEDNVKENSAETRRPFRVPGIEEHDAETYTADFSVDADAYLLQPTGAAAKALSKSQQAWETLKEFAESNILRLLQEAVPDIRVRLEVRFSSWKSALMLSQPESKAGTASPTASRLVVPSELSQKIHTIPPT